MVEKQSEIKKVGIVSLAKIAAALYFIFGILTALLILILKKVATNITLPGTANIAAIEQFTTGMLLIIPLYNAMIGFLAGIVIGWLYNLLAKKLGGIKIELK